MGKMYRSASGKMVDIDKIRLQNETVIAVGNMNVNARGDELGKGGKVVRTRDQVMKDYYKLKTPTAQSPEKPQPNNGVPAKLDADAMDDPDFDPSVEPKAEQKKNKRGSK